jgi:hypothetical protein
VCGSFSVESSSGGYANLLTPATMTSAGPCDEYMPCSGAIDNCTSADWACSAGIEAAELPFEFDLGVKKDFLQLRIHGDAITESWNWGTSSFTFKVRDLSTDAWTTVYLQQAIALSQWYTFDLDALGINGRFVQLFVEQSGGAGVQLVEVELTGLDWQDPSPPGPSPGGLRSGVSGAGDRRSGVSGAGDLRVIVGN